MPIDSSTLTACAICVAQSADFFDELRARCEQLVKQSVATRRGHFTPGEDEQVRQALVSYWNVRQALLETVTQIRKAVELESTDGPRAFVVAYAAALLLVDSARFMRRSLGGSSVIVSKLNEAEPAFGIPAGVYDQVQSSLTDPANVWHLFHAKQYFREHAGQLCDLASDPLLAPLLDIIETRQTCLEVDAAEYARARFQVRAKQLQERLRLLAMDQGLYAVQQAVGLLASEISTRPEHRPGVPQAIFEKLSQTLEPGDVIVVRKEHALTNYFLPGYWPHAALYLGHSEQLEGMGLAQLEPNWPRWRQRLESDEPLHVLEALKDGVRLRSLRSPLASDAVAILRPTLAVQDVARALARGLKHEGKPYDFDFDFRRSDRMVCTEVVYRAYDGVGDIGFELTRRAGRLTLSAEDILCMALRGRGFRPVAAYVGTSCSDVVTGDAAEATIRETLKHLNLPAGA